jgi:hypothetical protein
MHEPYGLDLATIRAEIDRLIAAGVLPGPQPSDAELLASLGIDLDAVDRRVKESFGWSAYYDAAQWVRLRSTHAVPHAPLGGTPLVCWRALRLAAEEAAARDQELGPEHLLVGLLRDAQESLETTVDVQDQRLRGLLSLPNHGPHPIRRLVERAGSPWRACSQPRSTNSTGPGEADHLTYRGTVLKPSYLAPQLTLGALTLDGPGDGAPGGMVALDAGRCDGTQPGGRRDATGRTVP